MKRSYITTFVAEGVVIASYLLAFRLVAVFFGAEGFGEYSLSRRALSLLVPLAVLGMDIGVARYVSYAEAEKTEKAAGYAATGLVVLLAGVGLLSAVLLVAVPFWGQLFFGSSTYSNLVFALPALLAGSGLYVVAFGYLRGLNRVGTANVLMAINQGLVPLVTIPLFHESVLWILVATGIGWAIVAAAFLVRLPFAFSQVRPHLREMVRFGGPRMPGDFISLLLFAMPGILVAHVADIKVAGIVAFGVAAVSMIGSGLSPVSFVLLPLAARLLAAGKVKQLRSEVVEVVGITLSGALVLVVLLEVFARPIVELYLGPSFTAGVDVLRLTLFGALPWAGYVTLRSVIDARHVRPINARNIAIAFVSAVGLAFGLRSVADPATAAVLAFVLALWLLAGLTLLEANRIAGISSRGLDRRPAALARTALLAALPLAILVSSPQRPAVSAVVALVYVVAALFSLRLVTANRLMLAYVGALAVWMILAWLRARYLLQLTPAQLDYGTSKTLYFVIVVLPIAAAIAILVDQPRDMWPVAGGQLAFGLAVAFVTVALLGDRVLGADRYQWQGNLIALGTVIAIQPWLIRNVWISGAIGVLGVAGIFFTDSRPSLAAFAAALVLAAAYWTGVRYIQVGSDTPRRLLAAVRAPWALLPLALLLLTGVSIAATYTHSSGCNCVTDRIVLIGTTPSDRDKLLERGLSLVLQSPLIGTGPGSFADVVPVSGHSSIKYGYPHNVPLEIAAETGLIGFLLAFGPLIAAWVFLFWSGVKRGSPEIAGLMLTVTVFFAVANISGDLPSARGLWIFGVVALKLGIDAWLNRPAEVRTRVPSRLDAPSPAS